MPTIPSSSLTALPKMLAFADGPKFHDPVPSKMPGQQPCERGDHGAIGPVRFRAGDLTAQDRNLVPQYQDLHVFGGVAAGKQSQPAEQPDHE